MSSEARLRQILNKQKHRGGGDWITRLQGERTRRFRRLWRELKAQADPKVAECLQALEGEMEKGLYGVGESACRLLSTVEFIYPPD
jgi:hypothetical protein